MRVILDVNKIISALIKDSLARRIIKESGLDFYFPEPSFEKIKKYKNYIIEKAGIGEEEFFVLLGKLFLYINLISEREIRKYWDEAKSVMEKIDFENVVFIAGALCFEDAVIWSEDKHFDKQNRIRVLKTKDMLKFLDY